MASGVSNEDWRETAWRSAWLLPLCKLWLFWLRIVAADGAGNALHSTGDALLSRYGDLLDAVGPVPTINLNQSWH